MPKERRAERLTLSVPEAADLLGLSRASAYQAIRGGLIPSIRVGKRIVVPRAALMQFLGESEELRQSQPSTDLRIIAEELSALATDFKALSERLALAAKRIHPGR